MQSLEAMKKEGWKEKFLTDEEFKALMKSFDDFEEESRKVDFNVYSKPICTHCIVFD